MAVDGFLLLDKPSGLSSNQALQKAKKTMRGVKKAGHTGTLDPLATGLLPLCLGEATKFSRFLLESDKTYRAVFALGVETDTCDSDGEAIAHYPVAVTEEEVSRALASFLGVISQVPPMYSALKHQGKPLYALARKGVEVERQAREVEIYALSLLHFATSELTVEVRCSKGTYIRSLAYDLGRLLGCGAHVRQLRRLASGAFHVDDALTLEQIESQAKDGLSVPLVPPDRALEHFPAVFLVGDGARFLRHGNPVHMAELPPPGLVRLYDKEKGFLGLGEVLAGGVVAPKRLLSE